VFLLRDRAIHGLEVAAANRSGGTEAVIAQKIQECLIAVLRAHVSVRVADANMVQSHHTNYGPRPSGDVYAVSVAFVGINVSGKVEPWPGTFAKVFDQAFGDKHLSWKCFHRSTVA